MTKKAILKSIRTFCLECMGGSVVEIEDCTAPKCALFELRRGKDPYPARKGDKNRFNRAVGAEKTV